MDMGYASVQIVNGALGYRSPKKDGAVNYTRVAEILGCELAVEVFDRARSAWGEPHDRTSSRMKQANADLMKSCDFKLRDAW